MPHNVKLNLEVLLLIILSLVLLGIVIMALFNLPSTGLVPFKSFHDRFKPCVLNDDNREQNHFIVYLSPQY